MQLRSGSGLLTQNECVAQKGNVKASGQTANFTGGSLLVRESRIMAKLLAEGRTRDEVLGAVLSKNLLQNSSKATMMMKSSQCCSAPETTAAISIM